MTTKTEKFLKPFLKESIPDMRPGDVVRVHQRIKEKDKERIQVFEGQILYRKHGKEAGSSITVRSMMSGVGVEKTFPLHSPVIEKIEITKKGKAKRSKLYYLRNVKNKKTKVRTVEVRQDSSEEKAEEKSQ